MEFTWFWWVDRLCLDTWFCCFWVFVGLVLIDCVCLLTWLSWFVELYIAFCLVVLWVGEWIFKDTW